MLGIDEMQRRADAILKDAQAEKARRGHMTPAVHAFHGIETVKVDLTIETEEDRDAIADLMREFAAAEGTDYVLLIMDALRYERKEGEEIPDNLEGKKGSQDTLLMFLYSREKTWMKEIIYIMPKGSEFYNFFSEPWQEAAQINGRYSNPFQN